MSILTTIDRWSPEALRRAVRLLSDQAALRPASGITEADAAEFLPRFGDDAAEVLWLAEDRGRLLRVSRMTIDEAGNVASEWRYHARGGRA